MRCSLPIALIATALLLGSCGTPRPATPPTLNDAPLNPPAATWPEADTTAECPYLDTTWLAETNGERVTAVGTDSRFDPPACVFWSYQEDPQVRVLVRHLPTREAAIAVINAAAPVDYTNKAEEPTGWSGGRAGGETIPGQPNAVYAVAKDTTAVVVFTHQEQSFKAQLIAKEVISNLRL